MMEAFTAYIKTITALTIFSALVGMLMPEGNFRKYAELTLGILILTAALSPLLRLFGMGAGELERSALLQGVRLERELFSEGDYREMEQERLEHTYQVLLEQEIEADLKKKYPEIQSVEAEFCREAQGEEYGALRELSIYGVLGKEREKLRSYAAKRYELEETAVSVK